MDAIMEKSAENDTLAPVADQDITPAHRAWMNIQIEQALDRKHSGKATYKTLEESRRTFGF